MESTESKLSEEHVSCARCGFCCYYIHKGKAVKCPFLKHLPNGLTKCIRYHNRLGQTIGPGVKCGMRSSAPFQFTGCPYNKLYPNKPMFPLPYK